MTLQSSRVLFLALIAFLFSLSCPASWADEIAAMDVNMDASKNSTLHVVEKISVKFTEPRHGIFRIMPVKYDRFGASYTVLFHLNSVRDENNQAVPSDVDYTGRDVHIKIGSASKTVQGQHTYVIDYTMRRAVNFFDKAPEVYWNVTGDQWPYPIDSVRFTLRLPPGIEADKTEAKAFLGTTGALSSTGVVTKKVGNEVYFQALNIAPGEGLTVAVKLPAGAMIEPSALSQFGWLMMDWYPMILLPVFTFIGLYSTWRHLGVDEEETGAIGVDWEPPKDVSPAEMGVVVDERADLKDVLSIIVDLAVRGYFKIVEIDKAGLWGGSKDFEFDRSFAFSDDNSGYTKTITNQDLSVIEAEMLYAIFNQDGGSNYSQTVRLSDLSRSGGIKIETFKQKLYGAALDRGWFRANPDLVRGQYYQIGGAILIITYMLISCCARIWSLPLLLGVVLSAVLFFFFAGAMPARTLAGVKVRRQSLAFARFVEKAEKERIRVLADKDPTIFGRLLPYAMVIGAAELWAKAFEGLNVLPPTWYVSSNPDFMFSPGSFVTNFNSSMDSMGTTMITSAPSAGSGGSGTSSGFSGGGFGGGGGGSW